MKFSTISFLSDLGTKDGSVSIIHSIIKSAAPGVDIIDITHDIKPYDINAAGLTLARAAPYLIPGVVIAMVGSSTRGPNNLVVIEVGDGQSYLIGPDNGVFAPTVGMVGGATKAITLDRSEIYLESEGRISLSRDIAAPAAAKLCLGEDLSSLGSDLPTSQLVPGLFPVSEKNPDQSINGQILWIDNFGNIQLNIEPDAITDWPAATILVSETSKPLRVINSIGELDKTELGLMVDSYGLMSIVVNQGSAAKNLQVNGGEIITLRMELAAPTQGTTESRVTLSPTRGQDMETI